jgi:DNA-binding XRE family transcriptional regulator
VGRATQDQIKKEIALKFKHHRKELRLSQLEVANLLNLQRTSITNIEAGRQNCSAHDYFYFMQFESEDFFKPLYLETLKESKGAG